MLTFFLTVWEIEEVVWSTSLLPQQPRKKSILFCSKYFLVTVSQLQMTFGTRLDGTADCRGKDTKGGCEFQFYRLEAWEVRNRWKQLCGRGISRSFATSILTNKMPRLRLTLARSKLVLTMGIATRDVTSTNWTQSTCTSCAMRKPKFGLQYEKRTIRIIAKAHAKGEWSTL